MTNNKSPKILKNFLCNKCDYKCSNKKDYNKHLTTAKHKRLTNPNEISLKIPLAYSCLCGKTYKHQSSLCNHKKKCSIINNNYITTQENLEDKPSFMDIITKNKEIMDALVLQMLWFSKTNN